jgi:DNA-binding CsgD family transcriptional regulator
MLLNGMKKTILLYASLLALMIILMKLLEYRLFIKDLSLEFYVGAIAVLFTILGVWVGLKMTRRKKIFIQQPVLNNFKVDENVLGQLGISNREYEVLELIAKGYSNQEIAEKLFISLNTVKTHSSNLFLKLEVKRRTQAVQKAKEMALIP